MLPQLRAEDCAPSITSDTTHLASVYRVSRPGLFAAFESRGPCRSDQERDAVEWSRDTAGTSSVATRYRTDVANVTTEPVSVGTDSTSALRMVASSGKGPNGTREGGGAMSTQGGTLQRRRTIELPMWPVAVLVVVAIAAAIGMTALGDAGQTSS